MSRQVDNSKEGPSEKNTAAAGGSKGGSSNVNEWNAEE
jgi:hypothetical protein